MSEVLCNEHDSSVFQILDGTTLINLDIVPNKNGDPDACLLRKINRCRTKFGMTRSLLILGSLNRRSNAMFTFLISKYWLSEER